MSTNREGPAVSAEQVEEQIRQTLERGEAVAKEVEQITLNALAEGRIEMDRMKKVIESVGRGASAGASGQPDTARKEITETLEGLQNALLQTFESARLTTQEEASRVGQYYENDLKQRLTELRELEATMLNSLTAAAKTGSQTGAQVLQDTVEHARRSGTHLGREVESSMRTMAKSLPEALKESALAGLGAARETTARAAEVASGILGGIADALHQKEDSSKRDKGPGNDGTR